MLNLSIRNRLRQEQDRGHRPVRPMSGDRRLGLGVDHRHRPKVQKSLFGFIFAREVAVKEDVGGISTLPRIHRDGLYRYGIWDGLTPELKRWFDKWRRAGGIAIL